MPQLQVDDRALSVHRVHDVLPGRAHHVIVDAGRIVPAKACRKGSMGEQETQANNIINKVGLSKRERKIASVMTAGGTQQTTITQKLTHKRNKTAGSGQYLAWRCLWPR